MKKMLCVLCIISLNMPLTAYTGDDGIKLKPMWEEQSHMVLYRCINIKDSVDDMMQIFQDLWEDGYVSDDELFEVQMDYIRIVFNLGIPSPI